MTRPGAWPKSVFCRVNRTLVLAWLCIAGISPLRAADHALLIGVADYPQLPKRLWLRGPVHDVNLMRDQLLRRGFDPDRVRVLVSRAGEASAPTRANIVREVESLQNRVLPGDRVLLYWAGHGSQQPQTETTARRQREPDGLDEVFLPADAARWDGQPATAGIANAIVDDEIGQWIDAFVDRGAKVWAVFDTCHASGMTRDDTPTRTRSIAAAELGLVTRDASPRSRSTTPKAPDTRALGSGRTDGRTLAFAARKHELASEEWLPRPARLGTNRVHGVFTWNLVQALGNTSGGTNREIGAYLLQRYRAEGRLQPVPQIIGDPDQRWP